MRLFTALDTPYDITEEIDAWWQGAATHLCAADWRHVPPRNWHLTLAFYGDVEGSEVDDLAEALMKCAGEARPIELETTCFGAFPRFTRPRVLWAGVNDSEGSGELKQLARCCRRAGHVTVRKRPAKESAFKGHITLARANEFPAPIDVGILAGMPLFPRLRWMADSLVLYQSMLHSDGAKYRRLEAFDLG
ncbi:MAG: RNA 2',3'-cyclic phosphodiesterase [Mariprofundus sp.]